MIFCTRKTVGNKGSFSPCLFNKDRIGVLEYTIYIDLFSFQSWSLEGRLNCNGTYSEPPNKWANRNKRVWMAKRRMVPKSIQIIWWMLFYVFYWPTTNILQYLKNIYTLQTNYITHILYILPFLTLSMTIIVLKWLWFHFTQTTAGQVIQDIFLSNKVVVFMSLFMVLFIFLFILGANS